MEFRELKQSVEKIKMSEEMQNRIIRNCRASAVHKTEEITMRNRVSFNFKKVVSIAAVIALCLCASVAAANHFGTFKDVTNWTGAVVGTEYVQATDEIEVNAVAEEGVLTITATFLAPDTAPYSEQETFRVGNYRILDASGNVIVDGEGDEFVEIVDGKAVMTISLDGIHNGDYKLLIGSFVGSKKADQPLKISGNWGCAFTI
ncbi:MAG: hypothetical protein E7429_02260 [Ruminococcaceae bacterium]|nr:hypothetical protein [Oscillospiraceae bacterium]